jgi:hypothetical protein
MATLGKGYTFGSTESVTDSKLHDLVDLGTVSDIVNADISAGADIDSTKLDLSSAGYLTAGGNFVVGGMYAFSGLVSIAQARIQTGAITSLMSVAELRATNLYSPDNYFDNMNLGSLASIAEGWMAKVNIGSLASIGSPIPYQGVVASLASGALPTFDGLTRFVGSNIGDIVPASGLTYISTKVVSATANSGDILIDPSKVYKVIFEGAQASSTANITVRFNSLSTNVYKYSLGSIALGTTPAQTNIGGSGVSGIIIISGVGASNQFSGEFLLNTVKRNADSAFISGTSFNSNSGSGNYSGYIDSDVTIASFEIVGSAGSWTGNVYLYEYALA